MNFSLFRTNRRQVIFAREDQATIKMVNTINSCRKKEHISAASRMLDAYERMFGTDTTLRGFLRHAEFDVTHYHSKNRKHA